MQEKKEPLVSLIIPVYKVEKYLERCFYSAINQTYKKLEIILVDDGSPDNSGKLCEELALKDKRVIVVHKDNGGLSSARNAGMQVANGDFYYFLDSDDYIDHELIEICIKKMIETNADMVAFNYKKFNDDGDIWKENNVIESSYIIHNEKERLDIISNHFLNYDFGFEAWNRMYRSNIIKENNINFAPNKLVFAEDICFNLCYLLCCKRVEVIDKELYFYLIRNDSIMGKSNSVVKLEQFINLGEYVYNFILKRCENKYIQDNFFIIMSLLTDNQLWNIRMEERSSYIVENKFFRKNLCDSKKHIIRNVQILGLFRGIKYSILSSYYLSPNKFKCFLLKRGIKTNGN